MSQPKRRHADALLEVLPVSDRAKADLLRRMTEPTRHYHTLHHVELLWGRHRRYGVSQNFCGGPFEPLIALAIAYHDAVYVGGAPDNEARSAALWLEVSAAEGDLAEEDRLWVAETIRATAVHLDAAASIDRTNPRGLARQWVLDLDLTPLGEAPDVFDTNMELLGAELPHLSAAERQAGLIEALRHFATARPLYRCRAIADAFEAKARSNFRRYLGDQTVSLASPHDFTGR